MKRGKVLILLVFFILINLVTIGFAITSAPPVGEWIYLQQNRPCIVGVNSWDCCISNPGCYAMGASSCDVVCAQAGKGSSTYDSYGKTCRSGEIDPMPYWSSGNFLGGNTIEYIMNEYWCWDGGQVRDYDAYDRVWACYCTGVPTCTPLTCSDYPNRCGTFSDGCGGTTAYCSCSSGTCCNTNCCSSGQVCYSSACCTPQSTATTCGSATCGTKTDNCGQSISCGTCPSGQNCENNQCVNIGNPYWANMKNIDTIITSADKNDLVRLVLSIPSGNIAGKQLEYQIYKDVPWWLDTKVSQGTTKGYTTWRAGKKTDGTLESGAYYFKVRVQGETTWYQSANLVVSNTEIDSLPIVDITSPADKSKFKTGDSVAFVATFEDVDDDLRAIWNFGDGTNQVIDNCLTGTNCNAGHSYAENGTKIVVLTAKELERNQEASDYTRVLIYSDKTNVFAIIDAPPINSKINSKIINFDAKSSYIAVCSASCPSGKTCYYVTNPLTGLKCYDLAKPNVDTSYNLNFNWIFTEGADRTGNWRDNYNQVVVFDKEFSTPLRHEANLTLTATGAFTGIDKTRTFFQITDTRPACIKTNITSIWQFWDGVKVAQQDSINDCVRINGWPSTTCCPGTRECNQQTNKCSEPAVSNCSEYNTEAKCNGFNAAVAEKTIEEIKGENYCGSTVKEIKNGKTCLFLIANCACEWNNNKCIASFDKIPSDCSGTGLGDISGNCKLLTTQTEGDCTKGDDYMTVSWISQWICNKPGDPRCDDIKEPDCEGDPKTKTIPCENVAKLPVFNWINFLMSIFVVVAIYYFYITQNKKY